MRGDWVRTASWAIKWPLVGPVKMSKIWVVKTLAKKAVSEPYVVARIGISMDVRIVVRVGQSMV